MTFATVTVGTVAGGGGADFWHPLVIRIVTHATRQNEGEATKTFIFGMLYRWSLRIGSMTVNKGCFFAHPSFGGNDDMLVLELASAGRRIGGSAKW
jgi:hypothetical protein